MNWWADFGFGMEMKVIADNVISFEDFWNVYYGIDVNNTEETCSKDAWDEILAETAKFSKKNQYSTLLQSTPLVFFFFFLNK